MKKVFLAAVFSLSFCILFSQDWVSKMMDPNVNFYEVQNAFNEHWQGRDYERGNGWKQYKRWEYNTAIRTYPSGERNHSKEYLGAWKQVQKMNSDLEKSNSPWEAVGPVSWESQGWNPGLGRINAIVVDPNNEDIIYCATPAGGLWKSINAGGDWISLTDNLPAIGASGLAVDYNNSNILYLATGDGDGGNTYSFGVMKSIDGGSTWETTSLIHEISDGIKCTKILMDPGNSQKLWASTSQGIFLTIDGGTSWEQSLSGNIRDFEIKPGDSSVIYASGNKFYKSIDGGSTFTQITNGVPPASDVNRLALAVSADNPEVVYFVAGAEQNSGFYGLYQSTDAGETFILKSDSPNILTYSEIGDGLGGQSWYDLAIAASPTDADEIYVGGINVWKSTDGGLSWEIKSHWVHPSNIGYTHADIHSLDFYGDKIYCGSDGGIFVSQNSGNLWLDLSEGLQISQYYRVAVSTTNINLILAASQDNGTNLFSGSDNYMHLLGGDGNMALIDYNNDDIMYSSYPGGSFQKSTDGGLSFSGFQEGIEESGAWVTPLKFHPDNPDILFSAFENVWRVGPSGFWEPISNFSFSGTLLALEVAPSDPDVIYTSTYGTITRTTNGGENWTTISSGLPDLTITGIECHPENPDELWITMSGYSENSKVFHSVDGGDNWENLTLNLPNLPVNCISYQVGSNNGIYIGTDAGVYYKDENNINWNAYNTGLPNVIVNQIVFQYQSSKIIVGTYGRGIWKNEFYDPGSIVPVVDFDVDKDVICEGETVYYINQSINIGSDYLWSFEGGTPAQSTEFSPIVAYNEGGVYAAKLWAQNENSADSLIYDNYITVLSQEGIPAPYTEDFESAASADDIDWYIQNEDDQNTWELNESVGFESNSSIWLNNFTNQPLRNDYLNSTTIDLSNLDTAFITMRVAYATRPSSNLEALRIYVSTDCGENWIFKKIFTSSSTLPTAEVTSQPFAPANESEWQLITIDNITAEERTENFRMQIHFRSNGGNNIYLDDINIISSIVSSISEHEPIFKSLNLYPNPALDNTILSIESKNKTPGRIILLDSQGREIKNLWSGQIVQGENVIPLSLNNIAPGLYTLTVISDLGNQSSSLVVGN